MSVSSAPGAGNSSAAGAGCRASAPPLGPHDPAGPMMLDTWVVGGDAVGSFCKPGGGVDIATRGSRILERGLQSAAENSSWGATEPQ